MATQLSDGTWEAVIDPGLGPSRVQRFTGATLEELTAKMETAQLNATQRIHTLNEYVNPDKETPMPEFKPRTLTPDELAQITIDLQNPASIQSAMDRLIEANVGAKPQQIREGLQNAHSNKLVERLRLETQEWLDVTPEYKKTPKNWAAMQKWMQDRELYPTKKNLTLAFIALRETEGGLPDGINAEDAGAQPNEGTEHIDPAGGERIVPNPTPTTRPRGTQSSGLRNGTSSNPTPPPPRPKWTRQQVLQMGEREYEQLYKTDHKFREFVDKM